LFIYYLSAAHCIVDRINFYGQIINFTPDASMFTIYAGIYDTSFLDTQTNPPYPGVALSVFSFRRHESYSNEKLYNDISLFRLEHKVELNSYIGIACLPIGKTSAYPEAERVAYAAGWVT
jgi:hypothetical protein